LDWIDSVLGREGLLFDWTRAGPWFGLLFAALVTAWCLWLMWKAGRRTRVLERENAALNQMTQQAWNASRKAYEEVEALRAEIQDLSDRNKILESDLRWLRSKAQEDRAVFVGALRRCIQAEDNDADGVLFTPQRPLLAFATPTAALAVAHSRESLDFPPEEPSGHLVAGHDDEMREVTRQDNQGSQ
jgi:hypothetical protein